MRNSRRRISGYTDFGGIRIPPLPQFIVMEDRATGTQYTLTHTGTTPETLELLLLPTVPMRERNLYGPYEGPYIDANVRLYISGGSLNVEYAQGADNANQRVLTRQGNQRDFIEILFAGDVDGVPTLTTEIVSV